MRNEYNLFIRPEEVFQLIAVDFFKREALKITGKFTHNVYTYCPLNGNYNNIITQVSKNISGKYVLLGVRIISLVYQPCMCTWLV